MTPETIKSPPVCQTGLKIFIQRPLGPAVVLMSRLISGQRSKVTRRPPPATIDDERLQLVEERNMCTSLTWLWNVAVAAAGHISTVNTGFLHGSLRHLGMVPPPWRESESSDSNESLAFIPHLWNECLQLNEETLIS